MEQSINNGSCTAKPTPMDTTPDDAGIVGSGEGVVNLEEAGRRPSDSQIQISDFGIVDHRATEYEPLSAPDTDDTRPSLSTDMSHWQNRFLTSLPLQSPLLAGSSEELQISDVNMTGTDGLLHDNSKGSDSGLAGPRDMEHRRATPSARRFNPLAMNPVNGGDMGARPSQVSAEVDASTQLEDWGLVPANIAKDSFPTVQDPVDTTEQELDPNAQLETGASNGSRSGWDFRKKFPPFEAFFNFFSSSGPSEQQEDQEEEEEYDPENLTTGMAIDYLPPPPRPSSPSPASSSEWAGEDEDPEQDHWTSQHLHDLGIHDLDSLEEAFSDESSSGSSSSAETLTDAAAADRAEMWAEAYLPQSVLDTDPQYAGMEVVCARTARRILIERALYPERRSSRYPRRNDIVIQRRARKPVGEAEAGRRRWHSMLAEEDSAEEDGEGEEGGVDVSVNF